MAIADILSARKWEFEPEAAWARAAGWGVGLVLLAGCSAKTTPTALPPPMVLVATVQQQDVPITSEWIGTVQGMVNANITAKVTGYLLSQDYKEGTLVKQGDVLFKLDPRQYQAVLDQAKAQLAEAQANLGKSEQDVKRYTPLAAESAISQQELDDAVQSNLGNKATVEASKAAVETAQLNLDFCTMTSPINGRAGISQAQVGDLVGPSSGVLTTVSTVDPVRVFFPVTEQEYIRFYQRQDAAGSSVDQPDSRLKLQLYLADGSLYPETGKFYVANRQIDQNTGTIVVVGLFANPQYNLRPGMYARVKAVTGIDQGALLVPQRAVGQVQGSYQVVVVGADNKLEIRPVSVGDKVGENWIIKTGLKAGETVAVEGGGKAAPGSVVQTQPYVATNASTSTTVAAPPPAPTSNPTTSAPAASTTPAPAAK